MIEERDLRPGTRMVREKGQNIGIWEIQELKNGLVIAQHVLKGYTNSFSVTEIRCYWRTKQRFSI